MHLQTRCYKEVYNRYCYVQIEFQIHNKVTRVGQELLNMNLFLKQDENQDQFQTYIREF